MPVTTTGRRGHRLIEGQEAPPGLPRSIRKLDGRWFGDARIILEGIELQLIYFGINEHRGRGHFPMHSHPFSEILCTISGSGHVTLRRKNHNCSPGTIFLALPGEQHASSWNNAPRRPWTAFIMQFNMEIPSEALERATDLRLSHSTAAFYRFFFLEKRHFHRLAPAVFRTVRDAFRHLSSGLRDQPQAGHAAVASFWLEFLALVSHDIEETTGTTGRGIVLDWSDKEKRLLRARHLLTREEYRNREISTVAREVGMSEYHFIRSFREAFGISPMRYRASIIMQRAARLLAQTDLPVEDIAHQVGYASAHSFSRAFHRQYGVSPRAYRRLHRME